MCALSLSLAPPPLLLSVYFTDFHPVQKQNHHHHMLFVDPALLHNIPHPSVVLPSILVVEAAGLGVGRTGGVGIAQQALDAGEDGRDVVDGTPLVLQDVEADLAVVVDVGVEHLGEEADVGGLVGVVLGEFQDELERPALPRGVVGAEDDGLPHHDVVVHRRSGDARGRIILEAGRDGGDRGGRKGKGK